MIELLAGLGQSGLNAAISKYNTDATIKANKQMAQFAYQKDLEMWNRMNEYNLPSAQMQRLKSAGLNPAMMYGHGSSVGNTTSQMPKYNAPDLKFDYQPPQIGDMIQQYQDLSMRQAQVNNVKATTESIQADTANKMIQLGISKFKEQLEGFKVKEKKWWHEKRHGVKQMGIKGAGDYEIYINQESLWELKNFVDMEIQRNKKTYEDFRARLAEQGLDPRDNTYLRMVFSAMVRAGKDPAKMSAEVVERMLEAFKNIFNP